MRKKSKKRDRFWKERQRYKNYIRRSTTYPYDEEDARISFETFKSFKPILDATNYIIRKYEKTLIQ